MTYIGTKLNQSLKLIKVKRKTLLTIVLACKNKFETNMLLRLLIHIHSLNFPRHKLVPNFKLSDNLSTHFLKKSN